MFEPELIGTLATLYGVGAAGTALLQARQVLRRGSSCEVSARFFASYAGGYAVWLLYGLSIGSLPLILVDAAARSAAPAPGASARSDRQPRSKARLASRLPPAANTPTPPVMDDDLARALGAYAAVAGTGPSRHCRRATVVSDASP
jgi:uncharacterized protein with PQ loop repeat